MAKHSKNYGMGSTPSHLINEKVIAAAKAKAELAAATPKPKELKEFVPVALSKRRQTFVDIRAP